MRDKILIIGGYGKVGSIVSEHLSKLYLNKVVVAGRSFQKAKKLTDRILNGSIPYEFDIVKGEDSALLKQVTLVVMCIDQKNTNFVEKCITEGIHYIDITADYNFIEKIERLNNQAKLNSSSLILSVGLAPGITNLLAQHCANKFNEIKLIDILILLGIGEKHGDAAYRWTFDNLHSTYKVRNFSHLIKSFTLPKKYNLLGSRTFYTFNFSDQHTLSKTINAEQIITRMAFDSKLLTLLIKWLRTSGITILFKNKTIQSTGIKLFSRFDIGSDLFAVKAVVENYKGEVYESSVSGNGEAEITAYVATEIAYYLLENEVSYGVNHVHNIITDIPLFLNRLKKYDETIKIEL